MASRRPPVEPCVRFSRTRLTDDLSNRSMTQLRGIGRFRAGDGGRGPRRSRGSRSPGSLPEPGPCYPALRRLPGRDSHPLDRRSETTSPPPRAAGVGDRHRHGAPWPEPSRMGPETRGPLFGGPGRRRRPGSPGGDQATPGARWRHRRPCCPRRSPPSSGIGSALSERMVIASTGSPPTGSRRASPPRTKSSRHRWSANAPPNRATSRLSFESTPPVRWPDPASRSSARA